MHYRKEIEDIFGKEVCRHALFYTFPGGLRFELSEGGAPLDQVLTALGKATAICEDLFVDVESIDVCLRKYASVNRFTLRETIKELQLAGISIPGIRSIWVEEISPADDLGDDIDACWVNLAFEVPKAKLQNLLWCAFARDFSPLHPNPHCDVYLFNFRARIMAHPYDDRGMDVIGSNRLLLQKLYAMHNEFLLDYDRDVMDQTFRLV